MVCERWVGVGWVCGGVMGVWEVELMVSSTSTSSPP